MQSPDKIFWCSIDLDNSSTISNGSSGSDPNWARQNMGFTDSKENTAITENENVASKAEEYSHSSTTEFALNTFKHSSEDDEAPGSERCYECLKKLLKLAFILICLLIILGSTVASKMGVVFITSNLHLANNISHFTTSKSCSINGTSLPLNQNQCGIPGCLLTTSSSRLEGVRWMWCLLLCISFPYFVGLIRSCKKIIVKKYEAAKFWSTIYVLLMESLHTIGLMLLLFWVLPQLDVTRAVLLMTGVGLVPSLLRLSIKQHTALIIFDGVSLLIQISASLFYPVFTAAKPVYANATCDIGYWPDDTGLEETGSQFWPTPLALILISTNYWENFIDNENSFGSIGKKLWNLKTTIHNTRAKVMLIVYMWKLAFTFALIFPVFKLKYPSQDVKRILYRENFYLPDSGTCNATGKDNFTYDWLIVFGVQAGCSLLAHLFIGLSIMGAVQKETYNLAILLATPTTLGILQWTCITCTSGVWSLGTYAFWNCYSGWENWSNVANERWSYFGFIWWVSQLWIARYLWMPRTERLDNIDRIWVNPAYCGTLIEQSLVYNKRRNDKECDLLEIKVRLSNSRISEELSSVTNADYIPCIKLCATMWHESVDEMAQILKSILRLDKDNSIRRLAREQFSVKEMEYYELESHIFFDDAFEHHAEEESDYTINSFVKQLVAAIKKVSFSMYKQKRELEEPRRYPTPYGGRLEYTLPFGTKLYVHMKDKMKIRHRKRWSQVMFMHYFVSHNIQASTMSEPRKAIRARNTFLLALDGDVDFKPESIILLLDLMKRHHRMGAVCGRIHPIGSGPLIWYQKFEYSLGYWLQKATEHVLGSVICCSGCFSLFRASSLMGDVMNTYSKTADTARQHIQYDQGEDRWLSTLLLQHGYRLKYSAIADVRTYAPEGLKEFFNQRRRWTFSSMLNLISLLETSTKTIKKNEAISKLFIAYQATVFIASILGPGTIYLLIIGGIQPTMRSITGGGWIRSIIVFIPFLIFFIIALTTKTYTQLKVAAVMAGLTMILQMVVLVGLIIIVMEDGLCNPATWIIIWVLGVFGLATLLHPQEGMTILYLPVYFFFVPTMYMILVVYSMCNLNKISWGTREITKKQAEREMDTPVLRETMTAARMSFQEDVDHLQQPQMPAAANHKKTNQNNTVFNRGYDSVALQLKGSNHALSNDSQGNQEIAVVPTETTLSRPSSLNDSSPDQSEPTTLPATKPVRDDMINPKWLEDDDLGKGPKGDLPPTEIEFWKQLIKEYLKPIDFDPEYKTKLSANLKDLRNKSVLAFFMINVLFIVLVGSLQVADVSVEYNCTLGNSDKIDYSIQPITFAFTVIAGVVMAFQVVGMLRHSLVTLIQVIRSTSIIEL